MTVTVFTKPYSDLPETLAQLQQAGFQQAPVVITPDASWTGYRPDLIRELAKKLAKKTAPVAA